MNHRTRSEPLAASLLIWLAVSAVSAADQPGDTILLVESPSSTLQQTLLQARARYRDWFARQQQAAPAVRFEGWLATRPLIGEKADDAVGPAEAIDPRRPGSDSPAGWSQRADLVDGRPIPLGGAAPGMVLYLSRIVHAERPVTLTVGLGGGDRLDAWLNGRQVAAADTALAVGRYGCAERADGTRVDQLLVDLDLDQGENALTLRLAVGSETSFCCSPSPDPVPRLWERIRGEFPAAQHPLLARIPADWLTREGWFAARTSDRERVFLEQSLTDCGEDGSAIRAELENLKQRNAACDDPGWLDLCVRAATLASLRTSVAKLRAAVEELGRSHEDEYPRDRLIGRLDEYAQRLSRAAAGRLDPAEEVTQQLMDEISPMQREMLVDLNPLLRDAEILFVQRYTYNSKHYYDDYQHITRFGGNLCALSLADGRVRAIAPQLEGGVFDRYDLHWDGQRILFGYRRPQREGFRIYEIGVDGSGLRQVTHTPEDEPQRITRYGQSSMQDNWYGSQAYQFWTDDLHPCYLPDGGICFASTRCEHGVLCTPAHYLSCTNLFRIDADGGGLRPLSQGALSEFTPTVMDDGRILYNRWEYVYKGIAAVQPLWVMRPDGSGSEEFYGNNVTNPGAIWQARQVPGRPHQVVCIGCGHEPLGIGPVLLLDLHRNKRTTAPMTSLTPEVKTENLRGLYQFRNGQWREDVFGPFYADPYPLSDKFFLVSCNPSGRYNDEAAYGIHLLDAFGNRVPIYHHPQISSWQPMPLRPRQQPPVVPAAAGAAPELAGESPGRDSAATVFLSDVYRGLEGVERGTVKYLRVLEQIPKPWAAEVDPLRGQDRADDGFGGHLAVSWNAHIWIAVLRGIVPVADDGSACFEVPARRNLFFQALDKDYMEVQRMRTFVNFEPGERRSCIGCHEHRAQAPVSRLARAFGREPSRLAPQPGETAPRPVDYLADIQPILDLRCVRCHNGEPQGTREADQRSLGTGPSRPEPISLTGSEPDLRGELTRFFNRSYESIFAAGLIDTIREWAGADYAMQHAEAQPPYSFGSHRSRLVQLLKAGHYDVTLSEEEWVRLVTWIDTGGQYYGSYFGRRNLAYLGQPDFRPAPTLASACGEPPVFAGIAECEPLPAELLAHWPLDEASGTPAADGKSGDERPRRIVGASWSADAEEGAALTFAGTGYAAGSGLGQQPAVSVCLWVRPDRLPNRWNPLLFTDGGNPGAFHYSLLDDGVPNLAIQSRLQQWTHRRAVTPLQPGRWQHLALTCDPRLGGDVVFYLDGKQDARLQLAAGVAIDLDAFRLGGWSSWSDAAGKGFQGAIGDVRIFRGTLTATEVAAIAAAGRGGG